MFERDLTNIDRLLNNPVPQHQLGVGRWGKEVTMSESSDFVDAGEAPAEEPTTVQVGDDADDHTTDSLGE